MALALGYANPNEAISGHVDLDDKLNSKMLLSSVPDLGQRGGWLINESGLYSLVLSSKLPGAKKFRRWVTAEVLPSIRKTGQYKGKASRAKKEEVDDRNSRVREAYAWLKIANYIPVPTYKEVCAHYASFALAGKEVLPLPEVQEHTYTAAEVGNMLGGISANMVGRVANQNGLKSPEYGVEVWDKSRHSPKQVPSWRYNEKAVERLRQILSQ